MTMTTKRGLAILLAAGLLGLAGDGLLRVLPWGINVILWVFLLLSGLMLVARRQDLELPPGVPWLLALGLGFAGTLAWRDSPTLVTVNLLSLLLCLGLAALRLHQGPLPALALRIYVGGLLGAALRTLGGLGRVLGEIRWVEVPRGRWSKPVQAVLRGLAIALPLLLLFGGLLTAADATFEHLVHQAFNWNLPEFFSHALLTLVWAWLAAGMLRELLAPPAQPKPSALVSPAPVSPALVSPAEAAAPVPTPSAPPSLGIVEIGTVLGLLDLLFLAFVLVQFRYFFGGAATVAGAGSLLTYAEYARRGFFELVTVSGLTLPLLLLSHWLLRKEKAAHERLYRILAGTMIALLVVIMISAITRMRLYTTTYGLTELRLYTTAFMGWLALVFGWFAVTVLRGRRERFTFGAVVTGLAVVVVLNGLNPDALIARTNLARPQAAIAPDLSYLISLSADAVPTLLAGLAADPQARNCLAAQMLVRRWGVGQTTDWRTWNWSRSQAAQAVHWQRLVPSTTCQP